MLDYARNGLKRKIDIKVFSWRCPGPLWWGGLLLVGPKSQCFRKYEMFCSSLSVSWFEHILVNLSRWSICWNKKGRKMKQESDQLLRERTQIVLLWIFAPLERVSLKANSSKSAYIQSRALQSSELCKKLGFVLQVLASTEIVLPLTSWDAAKSKNVLTRKSAAAT